MYPYQLIDTIRDTNPLVHVITNIVVANDSANGLLAIGASPFMSAALEEMAEVGELANGIVLNTGTLTHEQVAAMIAVGQKANQLGKPLVVDPVGVGATTFRKETITHLLSVVRPTLIRGNAGEIAALADVEWASKGVDAGCGSADITSAAVKVAQRYQCYVSVSGEQDIVTDGVQTYTIENGTPRFTKMTGAGCLLSCVCGAFLAVDPAASLEAVVMANCAYAVAGEIVAQQLTAPAVGTFRRQLLDQLSQLDQETVRQCAKIRRRTK